MSKQEFKILFEHALEIAANGVEARFGRPVPRKFEIQLHGLAEAVHRHSPMKNSEICARGTRSNRLAENASGLGLEVSEMPRRAT